MVLKYIPILSVLSVFVALGSLYLAYIENQAAQRAEAREAVAQTQVRRTTAQLHAAEQGASRAISRLQARLPESTKRDILRSLELPSDTTTGALERAVKAAPGDVWRREQLLLYQELKEPNRP